MDLHIYLAFVTATTIMISLPGPSLLLTIAHSISFGGPRALFTVGGATAGIAIQLGIAAVGLTSLLNGIAEVFEWLRWMGAAYLVYLGIRQWQSAGEPVRFEKTRTSKSNLFVQGLVITIFNPKSLIFIAAFLPQFIETQRPVGPQMGIIVPTFLIITFCVTSAWTLAAGKARDFFQGEQRFKSLFRTAGGLMIAAGIGLALARRGS